MSRTELEEAMDRMLRFLGEHCEAVQIMATRKHEESGGTEIFTRGSGNWYARQGMARAFMEQDQAVTQAREIAGVIRPPPDEGEEWKKS